VTLLSTAWPLSLGSASWPRCSASSSYQVSRRATRYFPYAILFSTALHTYALLSGIEFLRRIVIPSQVNLTGRNTRLDKRSLRCDFIIRQSHQRRSSHSFRHRHRLLRSYLRFCSLLHLHPGRVYRRGHWWTEGFFRHVSRTVVAQRI
jgi:hypothetical protein